MKEKASAVLMWIAAVPVTAKGLASLAQGAVTLFGVLTALLGVLMGICGFIWWVRRLRRQWIKLQVEEMELKYWQERERMGKRHHKATRTSTSENE